MKTSSFLFPFLFTAAFLWQAPNASAVDRQQAFVQEVLSGDTVRLKGGKTLKYTGVEAPPLQHIIPLVRVYGENSKAFNEKLVLNQQVWVEWGKRLRNKHNDLLGYVYLEDGTFINLELLKAGQAKARSVAPDLVHADEFNQAALHAQRDRLGLWKEEPKNPFIQDAFVGEKNTKIYYLPNSPELERIPQAHLVPFRSRVEASAAGYRACTTCKDSGHYEESDTLY